MRRPLSFSCEGIALAGTLDSADRATGLLIVSGGTQTRIGAHRMQALLAARVAQAGFAVFRFDRRGVGDSGGGDPGYAGSAPDIAAAVAAFRAECPHVERIAGFGLCDGATALALHGRPAGISALLLANPWVVETVPGLPPPAAIRHRYRQRLASREGWRRLLGGKVDLAKLARGLRAAGAPGNTGLSRKVAHALAEHEAPIHLLIAREDATAIAFEAEYAGAHFAGLRPRLVRHVRDTSAHGFASRADADWLAETVIAVLEKL